MVDIALDRRLIVALDVKNKDAAIDLVKRTRNVAHHYKVGLELFAGSGYEVIDWLSKEGLPVFVDLKLHDIPNTVANTLSQLARRGVGFVTVHGLGGSEMLKAAQASLSDQTRIPGVVPLELLGVTVLTHHHGESLSAIGLGDDVLAAQTRLTKLVADAGLSGVVCSADEAASVKKNHPELVVVCPGIRPKGAPRDDQKRTQTPYDAVKNGADYLVVGRPIRSAPDPSKVCADILNDIERGLADRGTS